MNAIQQGLLRGARYLPSPNCNSRPPGTVVDLLVLHNISLPPGQFGGDWIDALFLNKLDTSAHPSFADLAGLHVSAHLLIRRDGEIHQYVPFHLRAWHAGVSSYQGRENCNDFSIGIELEGTDETPYTDLQYATLADTIQRLMAHYPDLDKARITGHSDIAPQRKSDPGPAFEWQRLYNRLSNHCGDQDHARHLDQAPV
jgi:AmpD protein